MQARYNDFAGSFSDGVSLEGDAAQAEAKLLLRSFDNGNGTQLSFRPTSNMARILGNDPAFYTPFNWNIRVNR